MAGLLQPLDDKFPIVGTDGRPTLYFIKWAQQRQIDITSGITLSDLTDYLAAHKLREGTGIQITPSGDLTDAPLISADVQEILDQLSATRGTIIYRGLLGWAALAPGAAGNFLQTAGAGADPLWAAAGGGGAGKTTLGDSPLTSQQSPGVNNYLMRMVPVTENFTINKIAFVAGTATPTTKYQPFVYISNSNGIPGALLGSGPQVTGITAGYNEAPLSAPVAVAKGQLVFVGINPTIAGVTGLWLHSQAWGGFSGNGGSTVPAAVCPGVSFGQPYGFWCVT